MQKETTGKFINGLIMIPVLIGLLLLDVWLLVGAIKAVAVVAIIGHVLGVIALVALAAGFFMVQPNQAAALTLFGKYVGSVRQQGLCWSNPFYWKTKISLRIRNFETDQLKVNDLAGNPIEIAGAMLQRQQAGAIIAARRQIVEGAVFMVKSALQKLEEENIVELDEERKAMMVSNLLVVLSGHKSPQPVVNTGSIY